MVELLAASVVLAMVEFQEFYSAMVELAAEVSFV